MPIVTVSEKLVRVLEAFAPGADLEAAWAIGERFPDQDFSLVARTSFALMERLGISRVISFDDDCAVFRYGRSRRMAFAVLRGAVNPSPDEACPPSPSVVG